MLPTQTQPQLLQAPTAGPAIGTMMDDGSIVPAIAYDHGRSVLAVGHGDKNAFLRDAERVFLSLDIDPTGELHPENVIRRYALLRQRRDSVAILWRVPSTGDQVSKLARGSVAVTVIEI